MLIPALSTLASACGSPSAKKALRLPLTSRLTLDPARSTPSDLWPDSLLYAGLVKFDGSMNVVPDLAVALPSITHAGRSYTFTLRSDARFANGDPVTARDVAYSLSRALSPAEASKQAWTALHAIQGAKSIHSGRSNRLSGVQILGRHRVRISLVRADSTFLDDLALPVSSVLDRRVASMHGLEAPRAAMLATLARAGAGPFVLTSMKKEMHLTGNPHYFGGHFGLRDLVLVPSSGYRRYRKRQVDASSIPTPMYAKASRSPLFQSTEVTRAYYVVLAGITSRKLRVALDRALNRSSLARPSIALDPSTSLVPPVVPGYPAVTDPRVYQPARARAILTGHRIMISGMSQVPSAVRVWITRSWRAAGLRVGNGRGALRVQLISLHVSLPEPRDWLRALGDAVGLRSSRFDPLLARADAVPFSDEQRQLALETRAEKYLFRRSIVIPVGVRKEGYLISPHVQGLSATPIGLEPASEDWTTVTVS